MSDTKLCKKCQQEINQGTRIMKLFIYAVFFLIVSACSQQDYTEDELLQTQANMLKLFCDQRQTCINKIDSLSLTCPQQQDEQLIPEGIFDDEMKLSMAFQSCIIKDMDDDFMAKFNQAFPMTETEVTITRRHETDPKVLKIEEVKGKLKILNQLIDENELRDYISKNDLINRYESIVIISADDGDIGLILSVMDIAKNAGFDSISIARKGR